MSTITCKKGVSGSLIVAGDLQTPKQMTRYRDTSTKDIIHYSRLYIYIYFRFRKKNIIFLGEGQFFNSPTCICPGYPHDSMSASIEKTPAMCFMASRIQPFLSMFEVFGIDTFFFRMIQQVLGPLLKVSTAKS